MASILIVDDDQPVLTTLEILLRSEGHEVRAFEAAAEANDALWSGEPLDLVITDLRMSPIDGIQFIDVVNEARPDVPILVVSAYLDEPAIAEVERRGCAGYVKKPFTMEEILTAVYRILRPEKKS
ncbi:MAG TPA: response regulator [Kiritimatiellae bacterium]|nr:response regulator [Kiritimatiellia bacterium]